MKCPHCKREIENESVYCEYCGKKVKKPKWPLFLVFGVAVIGLVTFLLIHGNNAKKEREEQYFEQCRSADDYRKYLSRYPNGQFISHATRNLNYLVQDSINRVKALQAEAEKNAFNKCTNAQGCRDYLNGFPNGEHAKKVIEKLQYFIKDSIETAQRNQQNYYDDYPQQEQQYDYYNSSSRYVIIDGSELRLRLGPSTTADTYKWKDGTNRHPKVGEAFRYLGESGDFYKIDFKGTQLWVSKLYTHIEYR